MKKVYILNNDNVKANAKRYIDQVPHGVVVEFREQTRSTEQNNKMWAILTDIARQVKWQLNGEEKLISPEDWKDILSASLKQDQRIAKGVDGGFVVLGLRTSKMTKKEMADLIELATAFGAERGVVFGGPYEAQR